MPRAILGMILFNKVVIMQVEGIPKLESNTKRAQDLIMTAIENSMGKGLSDTAAYIKTEYADSRAKTGRGFTSRTHNLQNSIGGTVVKEWNKPVVEGYIHAGWGPNDYAGHVEMRWEGKYAYLLPGVRDKQDEILDTVQDVVARAVGKINL